MTENEMSKIIADSALKVHQKLGPGLLESTYEACLLYELKERGLIVEQQKILPLVYKELHIDLGYRLDLLIENKVIVEVKAIKECLPIHLRQLYTYLKLSNCQLGVMINFNVHLIKDGIKRVINKY